MPSVGARSATKIPHPSVLPGPLEDKNQCYLEITCSLGRLRSQVTFSCYGSAGFWLSQVLTPDRSPNSIHYSQFQHLEVSGFVTEKPDLSDGIVFLVAIRLAPLPQQWPKPAHESQGVGFGSTG